LDSFSSRRLGGVRGAAVSDSETLQHAVESSPIDAQDLGGAGAVSLDPAEHLDQVAPFDLVERWKPLEQRLLRLRGRLSEFLRKVLGLDRPAAAEERSPRESKFLRSGDVRSGM
jgi:hypothetical protein